MPAAHLTRGRETCWPRGSCVCAERRRGRGRGYRPRLTRALELPGFCPPGPGACAQPRLGEAEEASQGLMSKSMPFLGASLCSSPSFSKAERLPEWISSPAQSQGEARSAGNRDRGPARGPGEAGGPGISANGAWEPPCVLILLSPQVARHPIHSYFPRPRRARPGSGRLSWLWERRGLDPVRPRRVPTRPPLTRPGRGVPSLRHQARPGQGRPGRF